MGGALGSVVGARVHLRVLQLVGLAESLVRGEAFLKVLVHQLQLYLLAIVVLSHAGLLEGCLPFLVIVVVALRLLDVAVHLGAFHRDAPVGRMRADDLARDEGVNDLLAEFSHGKTLLGKAFSPGFLVRQAVGRPKAFHVRGHVAFGDLHAVNRGGHGA